MNRKRFAGCFDAIEYGEDEGGQGSEKGRIECSGMHVMKYGAVRNKLSRSKKSKF